jgi:putative phosphoesterase
MPEKKKTKRIALLSDVHGNLPALVAVLDDAAGHCAEGLWYCGDFLGYAPFPNEVVQKLREAKAISIIGNYDLKVLAFPEKQGSWKGEKTPEKYVAFQWNYERLSKDTKAYLESLPQQAKVQADGFTALLVHGSPDAIDEHLGSRTPETRFEELAAASGVDLIACGHSHEPFVKRVKGTWFVNPGSVGRPEGGDWRASYALLEFTGGKLKVDHRRVAYDIDRVVHAVHAAGLPDRFVEVFRQGRNLDQLRQGSSNVEGLRSSSRKTSDGNRNEPRNRPTFDDDRSVLDAVLAFARSCNYGPEHTHQVTRLALELFDGLKDLHGLGPQDRLCLQCGALLHDIGWIEGQQGHHKTSLRLIMGEPSLPFDRRERQIVALIARYHRKAMPEERHQYFRNLRPADQHRVRVLAGILRVADGLDRSHANVIRRVTGEVSDREIRIVCEAAGPADGEITAAEEKADLLENVFNRRCVVKVPVKGTPNAIHRVGEPKT